LHIGIAPFLDPSAGGIYQYSVTMLHALHDWSENGCDDEFSVFAHEPTTPILAPLNGPRWALKPLNDPSLRTDRISLFLRRVGDEPHKKAWRWLQRQFVQHNGHVPDPFAARCRREMNRWFQHWRVDLMLYPAPEVLSFEAGLPYVMAIHDLQHRLQPEFPEVSAVWEFREYLFRNGARHATLMLADSEVGKEDILNCYESYGVTPDRVKVLPFLPASYLGTDVSEIERQRVRTTYDLPERYLFYPAQFWPHKNHARIVAALGLLKEEHGLTVPIVFCGSHTGKIRQQTFDEVRSLASRWGVERQVYYLGYVPDQDMSALYAEAVALIMPTFFGPTNIPILEAWAFGCPVLTSDIRGIRDQVQDAAILVDPRSVEAIADGIYRLWMDATLVSNLAELGRRRLASYTPDDYRARLLAILDEAKRRLHSQKVTSPKS